MGVSTLSDPLSIGPLGSHLPFEEAKPSRPYDYSQNVIKPKAEDFSVSKTLAMQPLRPEFGSPAC